MKRLWFGDYYPEKMYFGSSAINKIIYREEIIWPDDIDYQYGFIMTQRRSGWKFDQEVALLQIPIEVDDVFEYCKEIAGTGECLTQFSHSVKGSQKNYYFVVKSTPYTDVYQVRSGTSKATPETLTCGYLVDPNVTDARFEEIVAIYGQNVSRADHFYLKFVAGSYLEYDVWVRPSKWAPEEYGMVYQCMDTANSLVIDGTTYSVSYTILQDSKMRSYKEVKERAEAASYLIGGLRNKEEALSFKKNNKTVYSWARAYGKWDPETEFYSVIDSYITKEGEQKDVETRFRFYGPYPEPIKSIWTWGEISSEDIKCSQDINVRVTVDGEEVFKDVLNTLDDWPQKTSYIAWSGDMAYLQFNRDITSGDNMRNVSFRLIDKSLMKYYSKTEDIKGTLLNDSHILHLSNGGYSLYEEWYDTYHPINVNIELTKNKLEGNIHVNIIWKTYDDTTVAVESFDETIDNIRSGNISDYITLRQDKEIVFAEIRDDNLAERGVMMPEGLIIEHALNSKNTVTNVSVNAGAYKTMIFYYNAFTQQNLGTMTWIMKSWPPYSPHCEVSLEKDYTLNDIYFIEASSVIPGISIGEETVRTVFTYGSDTALRCTITRTNETTYKITKWESKEKGVWKTRSGGEGSIYVRSDGSVVWSVPAMHYSFTLHL